MSGQQDDRLDAHDRRLLDVLYGQGADKDEHATSGRDAQEKQADLDAELAQLRQLRSVFAELRIHQEEPPPAGMALLMAAARQAAQERKPAGLWARLRAGWMAMAVHPAVSAAAAAVVVLGAAGYMLTRGLSTVESTAPSSSVATGAPAEAAPPAETSGSRRAAPGSEPAGAMPAAADERLEVDKQQPAAPDVSAAAPAKPATPILRRQGPRDELEEPQRDGRKREVVSRNAKSAADEASPADSAVDPSLGLLRGDRTASPSSEGGAGSAGPSGEATGGAATGAKVKQGKDASGSDRSGSLDAEPAPAPPPATVAPKPQSKPARVPAKPAPAAPPEPEPQEQAEDSGQADDDRGSDAQRPAERWYKLAKAAATKGDCEAVRVLAQRVRAEDPAFYDSRFLKDASIKKCL